MYGIHVESLQPEGLFYGFLCGEWCGELEIGKKKGIAETPQPLGIVGVSDGT
jgi:hypothetical protein